MIMSSAEKDAFLLCIKNLLSQFNHYIFKKCRNEILLVSDMFAMNK